MARLFSDHRQYEKAELAIVEEAAAAMMAMVSAVVVVGTVGICGPG
jgi:hypothetical protein